MGSKIYLPTLLIMLPSMGRCQQPITCDAGRFKAGETAYVTCNFHRSMKDIGHHVYVVQYPLNAPDDFLGNEIVRCFRSDGHELICEAAKGVQINSDITDRLTFHIPEVTTDFAGRYMCQLVPPDGTFMVSCSLSVEGTFKQNKSDADQIAQPDGSTWLKFIIASTTVAFLLGILCGITYFCIKRRRRSCSRGNSTQFDAEKPKYQDGDVLANARFKNNFNYKHNYTVSGKTDPHFCQDGSFEPIKFYNSGTCRAESCRRILIVRPHSLSSVSRWGDDDSSDSSIYASLYGDDVNSVNETDGDCSFYSSRQTTCIPL